jgi:UDP-2,4-diacetamido-2,4,6-trideoxy-beta-L-altropyranose hydrolase
MNIVFRVDSSDIIGTGHVYRCLNLAFHYKEHNIAFICKNHKNNLNHKIAEKYKVYELHTENHVDTNIDTWLGESQIYDFNKTLDIINTYNLQIDWLIIDHYAINKIWEDEIKKYVKYICVIDDYIDRPHNCNILINQQISYDYAITKYKNIINVDCKIYCGNDYLLLHPNYYNYINIKKEYDNDIKRINIFMGGTDTYNITEKIIDICNKYNKNITYDVIIGKTNKNYELIRDKIKYLDNFNIYYGLDFIGDVLKKADLCIGAPGLTSYERALVKVPCLCICVAENQKTVIDKFIKTNIIKYLGTIEDNYEKKIIDYLDYFNENMNDLKSMSNNCENFINLNNNRINNILVS